ncbi:unnamed protein product [Ixodes pacificus]
MAGQLLGPPLSCPGSPTPGTMFRIPSTTVVFNIAKDNFNRGGARPIFPSACALQSLKQGFQNRMSGQQGLAGIQAGMPGTLGEMYAMPEGMVGVQGGTIGMQRRMAGTLPGMTEMQGGMSGWLAGMSGTQGGMGGIQTGMPQIQGGMVRMLTIFPQMQGIQGGMSGMQGGISGMGLPQQSPFGIQPQLQPPAGLQTPMSAMLSQQPMRVQPTMMFQQSQMPQQMYGQASSSLGMMGVPSRLQNQRLDGSNSGGRTQSLTGSIANQTFFGANLTSAEPSSRIGHENCSTALVSAGSRRSSGMLLQAMETVGGGSPGVMGISGPPALPGTAAPIVMSQPITSAGLAPPMQQMLLRSMPGYTSTLVVILVPDN